MSEHTYCFDAGDFDVRYRVAKHHPSDGEPHEDWAEITIVFLNLDDPYQKGCSNDHNVIEEMKSVPKFMDHLTELANEDLKERQRDNHYED